MIIGKISSLILLSCFIPLSFAVDLGQIANEIEDQTQGYVSLSRKANNLNLKFKKHKRSKTYFAKEFMEYTELNDLFDFSPEIFHQIHGGSDFLQSKLNFYRAQKRGKKTKRPYFYLSSWKSLGHPPLTQLNRPNSYYDSFFDEENHFQRPKRIFSPTVQREIDELTATELTFGNELDLLVSGQQSIAKKIELVNKSQKFFYSAVMVQYCDEHTLPYIEALIKKAQEGVDVRLIVEKVWTTLILKKCARKLRQGGVKILYSKGFFKPKTIFTVFHDKFWISDAEEAVIGGQNMHDFENGSNSFNNHTLDKDVYVKGPAVTDMLGEYIKVWELFAGRPDGELIQAKRTYAQKLKQERENAQRGSEHYEEVLFSPLQRAKGVCRVLVQGDQTSRSMIGKTYLKLIENLDHSMVFNTPSFKVTKKRLNGQILTSLTHRAQEGIKVKIFSNGVDGSYGEAGHQIREFGERLGRKGKHALWRKIKQYERSLGSLKGKSVEKNLRKFSRTQNIEAWMYFNHVHSKQVIFDRVLVSTGSYNFDAFSHRNHESTLLCFDKKLADQSERQFVSELVNSTPVL